MKNMGKREQVEKLAKEILEHKDKPKRDEPRYKPEQWIADNQIYVDSYGWCWGIVPHMPDSQCLGKEEDVKNTLATGVIPKNQCPKARIVLEYIIEDLKGENDGIISGAHIQRRGRPRVAGHKQKATRKTQKRKGISVRASW